jgi:hypothetical protein
MELLVVMKDKEKEEDKKLKNSIAAGVAIFALVVAVGIFSTTTIAVIQSAEAFINQEGNLATERSARAPVVLSGDNIYIAWWTNNTANNNEEIMFRVSSDGGATFGDKINLSNTTDADSWRVEIAGEGDNVVVSWWETNQTSDVPVARISTDGGATFGPLLMLGMNGTLGSGEAEEVALVEDEE